MRSSGGIIYHLRALLHGKKSDSLWASHRDQVKAFLSLWNPPEKNLLVVGTSGGYSIPKEFLERFTTITAVEPDSFARVIFERRFGMKPKWVTQEIDFRNLDSLKALVAPDTAVLFTNLLGQLSFPRAVETKRKLKEVLSQSSWASYHDALSGEHLEFDTELSEKYRQASLAQMKTWIYPKIKGGTLEINAHQGPDLFASEPGNQFLYWQWRITPKRTHLIEGVFHVKT